MYCISRCSALLALKYVFSGAKVLEYEWSIQIVQCISVTHEQSNKNPSFILILKLNLDQYSREFSTSSLPLCKIMMFSPVAVFSSLCLLIHLLVYNFIIFCSSGSGHFHLACNYMQALQNRKVCCQWLQCSVL